jgi:hypothetical protein
VKGVDAPLELVRTRLAERKLPVAPASKRILGDEIVKV